MSPPLPFFSHLLVAIDITKHRPLPQARLKWPSRGQYDRNENLRLHLPVFNGLRRNTSLDFLYQITKEERKMERIKDTVCWGSVLFCAVILIVTASNVSFAAEDPAKFPSRPITLIGNFNPGSTTDLTSRKLADLASKILGKPIVVESRPGGAGVIGVSDVARATPDGYTIGAGSGTAFFSAPFIQKVSYNPIEDFSWIIIHTEQVQGLCVLFNARWKNFKEFIEEARKNPNKLKVAFNGRGTPSHILLEQVFAAEKVKVDLVPTSGGGEIVAFALGGHADAAIAMALNPSIKSKKLRPLAINGERRMSICPDIPTFEELGYKVTVPTQWQGLFAPRKVPPAILEKLNYAFKKASEDPSFKQLLDTLILTPMYEGPESARQLIKRDFDNMARFYKTFKIE
jgi:tripartite-type tricarboxylate transporter receptor subunit TctC